MYSVSDNSRPIFCERVERVKLNRKILYHFAIFAIGNELLIIKDQPIRCRAARSRLPLLLDTRRAEEQWEARGVKPSHCHLILGARRSSGRRAAKQWEETLCKRNVYDRSIKISCGIDAIFGIVIYWLTNKKLLKWFWHTQKDKIKPTLNKMTELEITK